MSRRDWQRVFDEAMLAVLIFLASLAIFLAAILIFGGAPASPAPAMIAEGGSEFRVLSSEAAASSGPSVGRVSDFVLRASDFRILRMRVTAYCPCQRCCGKWAAFPMNKRRTASGLALPGLLASGAKICAASPEIPFGTVIDIPGYGRAVVADRGGSIRGDRLDVFFATHDQAQRWGVRIVDCRFVPPSADLRRSNGKWAMENRQ